MSLNWESFPNTSTLIAQLEDRKYVIQFEQSFTPGKANTWSVFHTYTPGPYIFITRNLATREEAITLCEKHYADNLREVTA